METSLETKLRNEMNLTWTRLLTWKHKLFLKDRFQVGKFTLNMKRSLWTWKPLLASKLCYWLGNWRTILEICIRFLIYNHISRWKIMKYYSCLQINCDVSKLKASFESGISELISTFPSFVSKLNITHKLCATDFMSHLIWVIWYDAGFRGRKSCV